MKLVIYDVLVYTRPSLPNNVSLCVHLTAEKNYYMRASSLKLSSVNSIFRLICFSTQAIPYNWSRVREFVLIEPYFRTQITFMIGSESFLWRCFCVTTTHWHDKAAAKEWKLTISLTLIDISVHRRLLCVRARLLAFKWRFTLNVVWKQLTTHSTVKMWWTFQRFVVQLFISNQLIRLSKVYFCSNSSRRSAVSLYGSSVWVDWEVHAGILRSGWRK